MPSVPPFENITDFEAVVPGWINSGRDRGSIDILYSSCLTILLCCWVSTQPNAGGPNDKWYHRFIDKFHLALIGILGPDFIFGIAIGQLSSARRSVKAFKNDKLLSKGLKWTYRHAFFVDMGGIFLTSPDFPEGFPINAEQLHYLVKHEHVDFPDMDAMAIDERNTADTLSRLLTIWQVLWFSVTEIQRVRNGLPMTTLELTALSYAFVIVVTSICWYRKPAITKPRNIPTKDGKRVDDIRATAKTQTHPDLDLSIWYRTPVDFISGPRWRIEAHWSYYVRLSEIIRLPFVSRQMNSRLWDRFPSDTWLPPDPYYTPFGGFVLLWFSASFLLAWNFQFPTETERLMWRTCAVYAAFFMIYGFIYYVICWFQWNRTRKLGSFDDLRPAQLESTTVGLPPLPPRAGFDVIDAEQGFMSNTRVPFIMERKWAGKSLSRLRSRLRSLATRMRNISTNNDPQMAVPLRVIFPVTATCVLYIFCRLYLYIEDFVSLRAQPVGVYYTVNKFIPFLGD